MLNFYPSIIQPNKILKAIHNFKGLWWRCANWKPAGMIDSVLAGTGSIDWYCDRIELITAATINSSAEAYKDIWRSIGGAPIHSWTKKRRILFDVSPLNDTAQIIHIVSGTIEDKTAQANTWEHIGFKIIDAVLYATTGNGVAETEANLGNIVANDFIELKAILTPGVDCKFHKNGVLVATITTNLPAGNFYANTAFYMTIYNTAAADKRLDLDLIDFLQEE